MNRQQVSDKLADLLAIFSRKIEILSTNNEYGWNRHAENIFIPLLNTVLDIDLVNANIELQKQVPAIDLIDKVNRIAIQVTSDDSILKIKDTVSKFIKNELYQDFDHIYFLFLKEKGLRTLTLNQEKDITNLLNDKIKFESKNHLLDFSRLHSMANNISIEDLESLLKSLEDEIGKLTSLIRDSGPITTLIFDEDNELLLANTITQGLIEQGIRVRHFSIKLKDLRKTSDDSYNSCQTLYEKSSESKSTIILGTNNLKIKIDQNKVNNGIKDTLIDQHLTHFLFKLDGDAGFIDYNWIKPIVLVGKRDKPQFIIDRASVELRKLNRIAEIKGYDDFETIVRHYENKASISDVTKAKDSKKKIGYAMLSATDKLRRTTTYYIYLYKGTALKATLENYLKENKIPKNPTNSLILLLSKESSQRHLGDRLSNAKKLFKPNAAYYLDEFMWEYCTDETLKPQEPGKFTITNNFIVPEFKSKDAAITDFDQIENWLLSGHDPILVITGGGGIGKTTTARVIADKFQALKTNSRVIFIEASDPIVMSQLLRMSDNKQIDLYDFYMANYGNEGVSKDLFRINLDIGNFLLIIDGLDEVFSRIPNFNVQNFISSISTDFVREIGVGKVLLTCRSYFWRDDISEETNINHVEIEAFTPNHANEFFKSKFKGSERKIRKSMDIIENIVLNRSKEKGRIMPYIVDLVGKIVETGDEILDDEGQNVSFLDLNLTNDYVAYRIFVREQLKNSSMSIEQQCKFFIYFAVFYSGRIKEFELPQMWSNHFDEGLSDTKLVALKAHPLLEEINSNIVFKYDFFEVFFKSIYLSGLLLNFESKIPDSKLLRSILSEGRFGSTLFDETAKRLVENWHDESKLRVIDIIDFIRKSTDHAGEFNEKSVTQAISAIFALALTINQLKYNDQPATNTALLENLFGASNGDIVGLSIVKYSQLGNSAKFNFSNLKLINCYFDTYELFWECTFNATTRFVDCTFYNLPTTTLTSSRDVSLNNFVNPKKDMSFDEYFDWIQGKKASHRENLRTALEKFFKMFYANGHIRTQGVDSVLRKRYSSKLQNSIDLDTLLSELEANGVLDVVFSRPHKEYQATIKDQFRGEIIQFMKEGTVSRVIKSSLDSLEK